MKVAIVGVSGAVGQEFLKILEERKFPLTDLLLFGSKRSAGNIQRFNGKELVVKELQDNDDFKGVDLALVSAGAEASKKYATTITRYGAVMIDNSSAFRMDEEVPLVVPEVNAGDALLTPKNIIANPNCTTIQMVVALKPIDDLSPIKRVHVATYQSASGAGAQAMSEFETQTKQWAQGITPTVDKFAYQLAMNVIPQVDNFIENGYTKEEMKMYHETQKIMHSTIEVSATCVRIPVLRAHSEAVWVETESPIDLEKVKQAFEIAPGLILTDNPQNKEYPMPLFVSGKDEVYVGRLRQDLTNQKGISFWCVSDQIRKGAALNAVQIAEYLFEHKKAVKLDEVIKE